MIRNSALTLLLVGALTAHAHPKGFHAKVTITVTPKRISALVVMDVDSGQQCLLLREAVDSDRNGLLEKDELATLKTRLVKLATSTLKLGLSGAPLTLELKESKISTRDDVRANDSPLSVAVLYELDLAQVPHDGMELEFTDTAPDTSTIVLQVFQPNEAPFQEEVKSGVKTKVRLGKL